MHTFERSTADEVMDRQIAAEILLNAHCRLIMAELNANYLPRLQKLLAEAETSE